MKKSSMTHMEKKETPKMESKYHSLSFLKKAVASKGGSGRKVGKA